MPFLHFDCRNDCREQGRHASKDEIAECATQADIIDNKYKGAPVQVRVVMGKEPRQFLALFKGKFIIFEVRWLTRKIIEIGFVGV